MSLGIGTTIGNMTTQWHSACSDWNQAAGFLEAAGDALKYNNLLAAGNNLYDAGVSIQLGLGHWWSSTGTTAHRYLRDCLNTIDTSWPSGGTVDMDAILNAMLAAKQDEITQFIGIEQAFMAAIWNAPFNADYYAALARGFRQWP